MCEELKVGSIWRERDTRFVRYVRVLALPASGFSHVLIATCDESGTLPAKSRKTTANKAAFGKRYLPVAPRKPEPTAGGWWK